jgi:crotonobetainyl-CoA:carnitine CoA-transferase CaiB-like acyl-CoA transferase
MSITGQPDGVPGGGPVKVGVALVDILTGLYATIGIQAALRHRERTGEGRQIDLALLDVSVAVLANQAMNYLATGQAPGRLGNGHPNIVPYDVYPTSDGHLILAVGNDGQFAALAALLGAPGWAQDPDFATNAARVRQRHRLNALIAERLLARSSTEWTAMLEAAGVPGGPILTLDALFALEQGAVRGWVQQVQRGEQSLPTLANPLHLSATPVRYGRASPALDGDRCAVLRDWLGQG